MKETKEMEEKIEQIKTELKEKKIEHIYLNFVDFSGHILNKMVGVQELIRNTHVSWFDGISLNGKLLKDFKDEENSDWLVLLPDPFSFRILPFLTEAEGKSALLFCDIKNNPLDTRKLLENAVEEFLSLGITPMMGTQLIYSIGQTENEQNFYQTYATNPNTIFHHKLVQNLLKSGIDIEYYMPYGIKHERIDLVPDIASNAADKLFTAKWFAQNMAIQSQKNITFENLPEENLSSAPVHISLWKGKREQNLFFDGEMEDELSKLGRKFIHGILFHQKAIQAITKSCTKEPLKNYRIEVSNKRDDSILQVPLYFQEKQKKDRVGWSKRCIYQGLNAENNYYLMFATLLYAGLDGIQKELVLDEIKNKKTNQFHISELIEGLEKDVYLTNKLGKTLVQKVIKRLGGEKE